MTNHQSLSLPDPISILLVDDDPRNIAALETVLASMDCRLVPASSGTEALKQVLTQDFAAIVLDIHMPGMDGFETARFIRSRERSRLTPIIFVTAFDPQGTWIREGYQLGGVEYIYKPLDPFILRAKVAVFVDLFRKTGELAMLAAELERARAEAELRHQALHDGLTGLADRIQLHEWLVHALANTSAAAPSALLVLDVDRFKEVNDALGHQVGDMLLQDVGQRLEAAVPTELVARLGGDEFALLLPQTDGPRAVGIAEHLLQVLQAPFVLAGQSIAVDASVGIAVAPQHGQDADTLLRRAEDAMYQAKRSGLGMAVSSSHDQRYTSDRLALLGELRYAIDHDELLLHYQPKLDMRNGGLVGVEALLRWQHPLRGLLPPRDFVSMAERSGLIHPLSLWVQTQVLRQQQAWRRHGLHIQVAINLSRRVLHDPQLPDTLTGLLASWAVPASALVLEITESGLMADPVRARDNLSQLSALGVCVSIDDFGTGYSSLASLHDLSVDELKIDQSFIRAMAADADARAIVRAIIDLADALRLRVVAEGVEDRATWDVLASLGCDVAQGYFLSPPLPANELEAWIAEISPSFLAVAEAPQVQDALRSRIRARGARLTAEEEFLARKEAEVALRASEERNRLALRSADMGTWDWDPPSGTVTWSPETELLHGLLPGAFERSFAAFKRIVHPDDWAALEADLQTAIAEQREFLSTYRPVFDDGSVHWLAGRGRGIYAADGTMSRMTGTIMDVTQHKLAEEALQASEERFRNQYRGFPLPTYTWLQVGGDFVLEDLNVAAETKSGGRHDLLGRQASGLLAEQPDVLEDLRICASQGKVPPRETSYRYPLTGVERLLTFTYVFVPPHLIMVHTEDITDARHAERQREALAQSEKLRALGQMASGIAHDLNQSLMLVSSYTDLARQALKAGPLDPAELDDLLSTATRAALDGGEMVKRLLSFGRAAPEMDTQRIDLSSVVREAVQLTSPRWRDATQAEGRPVSLHLEPASNPMIQGSPARLREMLTNLIFNAVDALPAGGTIRLVVTTVGAHGVVEVIDSGIGMSADVQRRVFEPFFTTKGEAGTGLGLAMVFSIVEQHNGHIEVDSTPGNGTTFRISLPLIDVFSVEADLPSSEPSTGLQPPRSLRVLVVDDEPMMTRAVVRMLKPSGHLASVAASGEEAMKMLAEQQFDVVLSDVGMGAGMNGWELAEAVKRAWPSVRFLLATGWGAAIDPNEAQAKGVEAVLSKPYRSAELLRALATTDTVR